MRCQMSNTTMADKTPDPNPWQDITYLTKDMFIPTQVLPNKITKAQQIITDAKHHRPTLITKKDS
eukprot:2915392-Ditylum_brightwellii.AAC.2